MIKNALFWKKTSIVFMIANMVALTSTISMSLIYSKKANAYDAKASKIYISKVKKNWQVLQVASNRLIESQKKVKNDKTLSSFLNELTNGDKKLLDIQKQIKALNVDFRIPDNQQKYSDLKHQVSTFLDNLTNYLESINETASKNPKETNRDSFDTSQAKIDSVPSMASEMDSFTGALGLNKLPDELFSLHDLTSFYEPIWSKKEAEEEKRLAEQKKRQQELAAKRARERYEREKARKAQQEANYKASCKEISYKVLDRDADSLIGTKVHFRGQVFNVDASEFGSQVQLYVTNKGYDIWDDQVLLAYDGKMNVLKDEIIDIWGEVSGSQTYESQAGYQITVPGVDVKYYSK